MSSFHVTPSRLTSAYAGWDRLRLNRSWHVATQLLTPPDVYRIVYSCGSPGLRCFHSPRPQPAAIAGCSSRQRRPAEAIDSAGDLDPCILPSPDTDLEAFSHMPTHGSFAALPCRGAAMTNYLKQRFLSYYIELL
jgi:hypothetical protein